MPHLVVLYSANLEADADMSTFCRAAADALLSVDDDSGKAVFPIAGVRVFAYPAAQFAVADGSGDHGFIYLQLRMAKGRSAMVHQAVGEALSAVAKSHFAALLDKRKVGMTVQVDEGHEVFDAKIGNLHPHFQRS